jgi:hypothetical protein
VPSRGSDEATAHITAICNIAKAILPGAPGWMIAKLCPRTPPLLSERLVPGGGPGPRRKQCSPGPGRQGAPLYPVRRTSSCLQCS